MPGPRWLPTAIFYNCLIIGAIQVVGGVAELGYAVLGPSDRWPESFVFGIVALGSGAASLMLAAGLRTLDRSV